MKKINLHVGVLVGLLIACFVLGFVVSAYLIETGIEFEEQTEFFEKEKIKDDAYEFYKWHIAYENKIFEEFARLCLMACDNESCFWIAKATDEQLASYYEDHFYVLENNQIFLWALEKELEKNWTEQENLSNQTEEW